MPAVADPAEQVNVRRPRAVVSIAPKALLLALDPVPSAQASASLTLPPNQTMTRGPIGSGAEVNDGEAARRGEAHLLLRSGRYNSDWLVEGVYPQAGVDLPSRRGDGRAFRQPPCWTRSAAHVHRAFSGPERYVRVETLVVSAVRRRSIARVNSEGVKRRVNPKIGGLLSGVPARWTCARTPDTV